MFDLPYRIEQTRNRTSRAIFNGNGVLIRLARNLSRKEEQRHIDVLLKRMSKVHARMISMPLIDPFQPLLKGESTLEILLADGERIFFEVIDAAKNRIRKTGRGFRIERSLHQSDTTFHRLLWKLLSLSMREKIEKRVRDINASTLQLPIKSVSLKLTKSRWGSCSHSGKISLSSALLFVPERLLDYVIGHELCHIPHPNHSKAFWNEVERVLPEYRERLKELRTYRLPGI